jgi:CBS domain-containing protein
MKLSGPVLLPVVNERGIVLGLIDQSLEGVEPTTPVTDLMDPGPITVRPSTSVESAIKRLTKSKRDALLVTASDGQLLGLFRPPVDAIQSRVPEVGVWD